MTETKILHFNTNILGLDISFVWQVYEITSVKYLNGHFKIYALSTDIGCF
jgi:hypothetical protein